MKRIGVFLCWCGSNIAEVVNVDKVIEEVKKFPGVVWAEYYKYFCSAPGQQMIEKAIKEKGLDAVVVSACSPTLHEVTFRGAVKRAGLNEYQLEIANVREQCSWVHRLQKTEATEKAIKLIQGMVEKVKANEPLSATTFTLVKRALVIGAGISGMQAAIDIADSGFPVILVEKRPFIGGHMAQLSETFPTLDCSQCIITPKMVELIQHPRIQLLTSSEVIEVSGHIGNFKVKIRKSPIYVRHKECTACGLCIEKCPVKVDSDFDLKMGVRKAIYVDHPQAVPNKPVIDSEHCLMLIQGKCGICQKVCEVGAIDYHEKEEFVEVEVGAIVVATGFATYPLEKLGEYGAGRLKNVIDGLSFERLNSASGPTGGKILRPSDGKEPKEIVFIHCAGSRDPESGVPYCSKICCMYSAKHAVLYKRKVPDGCAYNFYIDIRAGGKGYEEFIQRATEEEGIIFLRGKVARLFEEGEKTIVWGVDTLTGKNIEIACDLVVLATALIPSEDAKGLARILNISVDEFGFYKEAHIKLRPVESSTRGVFFAGCGSSPKDIPDAIAQAGSAAAKVVAILSKERLEAEPQVAWVNEELCKGCGICVAACPFEARKLDPKKRVAKVNEALCQGCGACVVACPNRACELRNMTLGQIIKVIEEVE